MDNSLLNPALITFSHPANASVYPSRDGSGGLSTRAATVSLPFLNGAITLTATVYAQMAKDSDEATLVVSMPSAKGGVTVSKPVADAVRELVNERITSWSEWGQAQVSAAIRLVEGTKPAPVKAGKASAAMPSLKLSKLIGKDGETIASAPVEPTEPDGDTSATPAPLTGAGTGPTAGAPTNGRKPR